MAGILKVSEAASLAIHTMVLLVKEPEKIFTTREIAEILGASKNHLSKVLKNLEKVGFLKAVRGPKGGFSFAEGQEKLTLLEIYEVIEGPLTPVTCLLKKRICKGHKCIFGNLTAINKEIIDYFSKTTLLDLSDIS